MPKKARELGPLEVKRLSKPGLHPVGGVAGLQLQVKETGARSWILRVMVGDERRHIGLGGYPDVTLATAREKARAAREQIESGIDPIEVRKLAREALRQASAKAITFDQAAKRWHNSKKAEYRNAKHADQVLSTLTIYASPAIGKLGVSTITLRHVLDVLEPLWTTKTETATRLRGRIETSSPGPLSPATGPVTTRRAGGGTSMRCCPSPERSPG